MFDADEYIDTLKLTNLPKVTKVESEFKEDSGLLFLNSDFYAT